MSEAPSAVKILRFDSLPSTNLKLMELGRQGAPHGTVVFALEQTAGRGTNGRSFFSPPGGVYLSVLVRGVERKKLSSVTPMAAVAVRRTVAELCGVETLIKPVNDLYLDGRKVCGILTQASSSGPKTDFIVIGVGVNLFAPEGGFPKELSGIAGAISNKFDFGLRERFVEGLSRHLAEFAERLSDENFAEEIRNEYNENLI